MSTPTQGRPGAFHTVAAAPSHRPAPRPRSAPCAVTGVVLFLALACAAGCRRTPASPAAAHLGAGDALLNRDPGAAIARYEQALALGATEPALEKIALARAALGEWKAAEQALLRLPPAAQAKPDNAFLAAQVKLAAGDRPGARAILEKVIAGARTSHRPLLLYAALANNDQQAAKARALLDAWQPAPPAEGQPAPAGGGLGRDSTEFQVARAALASMNTNAEGPAAAGSAPPAPAAARGTGIGDLGLALAMLRVYDGAGQRPWATRLLQAMLDLRELPAGVDRQLASMALEMGELALASRSLERAPTEFNADPQTLALKARVQQQRGALGDAVATWTRAVQALPADASPLERARLQFGAAAATLQRGDEALARKSLEAIVAQAPDLAEAGLTLAGLELKAKQAKEAAARLQAIISRQPDTLRAYPLLVAAQLALDDVPAAQQSAENYLRLSGQAPDAVVLLSQIHLRRGQRAAGTALIRKALEARPGDMLLVRALSEQVAEREGAGKAAAVIEAEIERAPAKAPLLGLLGEIERRAGRLPRAEAAYRRAAEASPQHPGWWRQLAAVRDKLGDRAGAINALERALSVAPDEEVLRHELAAKYLEAGRPAPAAELYEKLLASSPDALAALNNLAMLYADHADLKQGARAVALARRARKVSPQQPAVADTLGWSLVQQGDPKDLPEAVELLAGSAAALNTAEAHYHHGMALLRRGDQAAGRTALKQALKISPRFPAAPQARAALAQ